MYLSINIETQKSNLFLDFLNLLKKDKMINDFQVISNNKKFSNYEKEVFQDIEQLSTTISHAQEGKGRKKDMVLSF